MLWINICLIIAYSINDYVDLLASIYMFQLITSSNRDLSAILSWTKVYIVRVFITKIWRYFLMAALAVLQKRIPCRSFQTDEIGVLRRTFPGKIKQQIGSPKIN